MDKNTVIQCEPFLRDLQLNIEEERWKMVSLQIGPDDMWNLLRG